MNLPENIANKILMDAMQLRNIDLCEELRRNVDVYMLAIKDYGLKNSKVWESIEAAEERYIGGAPDVCDFDKHMDWLKEYKKWKRENKTFVSRQKFPKFKSLYS